MIHRIKVDTLAELMQSEDYRDRFVAEYIQLKQRYEKLKTFNTKIEAAVRTAHLDNGVDEPLHDCPAGLLREQQAAMGEYLHLLEVRAVIEDIDLEDAIDYYIEKALKAERAYHGCEQSCCDGERCEKGCCDSSEGSADVCGDTENTEGLQSASEALPDGVMSLEYTIGFLEAAIHCDEHVEDEACRGSACPLYREEACIWGDVESYVSALYHLKRYAETK
jgi:hypothetical protein